MSPFSNGFDYSALPNTTAKSSLWLLNNAFSLPYYQNGADLLLLKTHGRQQKCGKKRQWDFKQGVRIAFDCASGA